MLVILDKITYMLMLKRTHNAQIQLRSRRVTYLQWRGPPAMILTGNNHVSTVPNTAKNTVIS